MAMKVEFRRKVAFHVFDVVAELEIQEERKDIQEFLKKLQESPTDENDLVFQRICSHLQERKLVNKDRTLTEKGEEAMSSGFVFEPEEGKYRLWCVINDGFLKTSAIYFERQKPRKYIDKFGRVQEQDVNNLRSLPLSELLHREHDMLPLDKNEEVRFFRIKRIGNDESCTGIAQSYARNSDPLELWWVWDGLKRSCYFWKGKLTLGSKTLEISDYHIPVDKPLEEIWKLLAEENHYPWSASYQRIQIPFGKESEAVYQNFQMSKDLNTDSFIYGHFDSAHASEIPVMPACAKDASQWRDFLVEKKLMPDYMLEADWTKTMYEYNQMEPLVAYALAKPSVEEFLEILRGKGDKKAESFWHLAATYDLNPYGETK